MHSQKGAAPEVKAAILRYCTGTISACCFLNPSEDYLKIRLQGPQRPSVRGRALYFEAVVRELRFPFSLQSKKCSSAMLFLLLLCL
ncbi:hypothetical protein CEXT_40451 [Caerostris extrusa]|uniref:Uncharacterized protein n=1 Tax=Caerostris extrusa TaxID=172846 RepID=A0AAV4YB24_CAEEX|nr:hypothetical protein CEXT_40451 [Caerostris extrusa]